MVLLAGPCRADSSAASGLTTLFLLGFICGIATSEEDLAIATARVSFRLNASTAEAFSNTGGDVGWREAAKVILEMVSCKL